MDRNKNLLIIGAGVYGILAQEIAESMHCFDKVSFLDDYANKTSNGIDIIGKSCDINKFEAEYGNVFVAIGNAASRMKIISQVEESPCRLISLISPKAYVSPTARIGAGCIIEPLAVVHTGCVLTKGCIVSAGAVINHTSMICDGVHIDCNATVEGDTFVPAGVKINAGVVYKRDDIKKEDLIFGSKKWQEKIFNFTVDDLKGEVEQFVVKECLSSIKQ